MCFLVFDNEIEKMSVANNMYHLTKKETNIKKRRKYVVIVTVKLNEQTNTTVMIKNINTLLKIIKNVTIFNLTINIRIVS